MCLQYLRSAGRPAKRRLLTWRGGYHGDTFHPMSVCDPDGGMHSLWRGVLPEQVFAPTPRPRGFDADSISLPGRWPTWSSGTPTSSPRSIVEPVVQGAGGMRFHDPGYLRVLRELADAHGRAAGLRRDRHRLRPHRRAVRRRPRRRRPGRDVRRQGPDRRLPHAWRPRCARRAWPTASPGASVPVLAHGPTFMGNPLAAAIANASIDLLLGQDWRAEVAAHRDRPARRPGTGRATCPACATCGCSARSASSSSTTTSTWRPPPTPRSADGRLAAAVPRPDLHHAALRQHRRGPRHDRRGDGRRRARSAGPPAVAAPSVT